MVLTLFNIRCSNSFDVEKEAEKILLELAIDNGTGTDSILAKVAKRYDLPGVTASAANSDSILCKGVYGVSSRP